MIAIRSRALRGASSSLAGSTFVYAVISGIRSGIAFVMLPLYVRAVTPAEYGQLAIAWVIASLLTGVLTFGLETAVTRWYFRLEPDPEDRERFIASAWKLLVVGPNLIVIVGWLFLAAVAGGSLPVPLSFLVLAALQASLWVSSTTVPFALLRAQRRIRMYALLNWIFVAVSVVATTTLLYASDIGAIGWLIGNLAATVALGVVSAYVMRSYLHVRFSRTLVWPAVTYGIPLIPHVLALWVLALVDRLILQAYTDSADVGIYNLAYQVSMILVILLIAANQGTVVEFGRAIHDQAARIALRRVVTLQFTVTIALATSIALLGPVAIALLLPESYGPAAGLVGWLVLGNLCFCLYLLPMNTLTVLSGKTRWAWLATASAAAANVVLNIVLIPRIGVAGAAYASAIGYLVLLVAIAVMAHALRPPGIYDGLSLTAVATAGAIAYVGGVLTAPSLDAQALVIRTLWLVGAALVITLLLQRQRDAAVAERTPA